MGGQQATEPGAAPGAGPSCWPQVAPGTESWIPVACPTLKKLGWPSSAALHSFTASLKLQRREEERIHMQMIEPTNGLLLMAVRRAEAGRPSWRVVPSREHGQHAPAHPAGAYSQFARLASQAHAAICANAHDKLAAFTPKHSGAHRLCIMWHAALLLCSRAASGALAGTSSSALS